MLKFLTSSILPSICCCWRPSLKNLPSRETVSHLNLYIISTTTCIFFQQDILFHSRFLFYTMFHLVVSNIIAESWMNYKYHTFKYPPERTTYKDNPEISKIGQTCFWFMRVITSSQNSLFKDSMSNISSSLNTSGVTLLGSLIKIPKLLLDHIYRKYNFPM